MRASEHPRWSGALGTTHASPNLRAEVPGVGSDSLVPPIRSLSLLSTASGPIWYPASCTGRSAAPHLHRINWLLWGPLSPRRAPSISARLVRLAGLVPFRFPVELRVAPEESEVEVRSERNDRNAWPCN